MSLNESMCNILICMQQHSQHNNDERTHFFRKIYLSLYLKGLWKVYVWEVSWRLNKAATYWPPALLAKTVLLSHSGLLNQRPWFSLLELQPLTPNSDLQLTRTSCSTGLYNFWRPPASVSIASALNSTCPQSRLSPDIFDWMHLLFTQVHFYFDSSAGSVCYKCNNRPQIIFLLLAYFDCCDYLQVCRV